MPQPFITEYIDIWEPPDEPRCSGCTNARISGEPTDPMARCAMGYGKTEPLTRLIRPKGSRGFRNAAECEDYETTEDGE